MSCLGVLPKVIQGARGQRSPAILGPELSPLSKTCNFRDRTYFLIAILQNLILKTQELGEGTLQS